MTMIPKEDRILAQPGEVFGVHYPTGRNVAYVPYDSSIAPLCCGVSSSDLSRFHNSGVQDDELPIGAVITTITSRIRRLPALRPVLRGKIPRGNKAVVIIKLLQLRL